MIKQYNTIQECVQNCNILGCKINRKITIVLLICGSLSPSALHSCLFLSVLCVQLYYSLFTGSVVLHRFGFLGIFSCSQSLSVCPWRFKIIMQNYGSTFCFNISVWLPYCCNQHHPTVLKRGHLKLQARTSQTNQFKRSSLIMSKMISTFVLRVIAARVRARESPAMNIHSSHINRLISGCKHRYPRDSVDKQCQMRKS